MATVATPLVPSTTNTVGQAFGAIIGGLVVKWLVAAPFVVQFAATPFAVAIGLTPMGMAGLGGVLATALGGYAATHIAEVREAASFIVAVNNIKATASFPEQKDGSFSPTPMSETSDSININKPVT